VFANGANAAGSQALGERDVDEREDGTEEDMLPRESMGDKGSDENTGGWLENDDIEDF